MGETATGYDSHRAVEQRRCDVKLLHSASVQCSKNIELERNHHYLFVTITHLRHRRVTI